ncbi:MAG: hypothetical protein MdMp024_0935 [Bacteroidales bacterium]
MNDNIVARIKELMTYYSLNPLTLSQRLGYKSSEKLSRLFREGNEKAKPSYKIIYDIANIFEIDADWLLTGNGDMLKKQPAGDTGVTDSVLRGASKEELIRIIEAKEREIGEKDRQITLLLEINANLVKGNRQSADRRELVKPLPEQQDMKATELAGV